jgi:hypothetical protein
MVKHAALLLAILFSQAQTAPPDPLHQARALYNAERFAEAAALAEQARQVPALANAAAVVLARAHLEQYRQTGVMDALQAGLDALRAVNPGALAPRDYVEFLLGLGEAVYLDDPPRYAAAAEFFQDALDRSDVLEPGARELVFAWWAGSLDRQAQFAPEAERGPVYERLLAGAERERQRDDHSATAWYWLVVGARGTGDLERAIGLAVAAWIRAPHFGPRGGALRIDLDRLVTEVVLPDRARQLTPGGDPRPELDLLRTQWEDLKKAWP